MTAAIAVAVALAVLLSGVAVQAQETSDDSLYAKGLIPFTPEQLEEIHRIWPRVIGVNLNWLGFERVNEERVRKGLKRLEPGLIKPVGHEVESAVAGPGAVIRSYGLSQDLAGDLPAFADNSKLPYFPPIRSQGSLGSCASFSIVYTQLSYMHAFLYGLDITDNGDNTNKFSPKWAYNMVNNGENAGSYFSDNYEVLEKHGAATWAEFPYDSNYLAWCLDTNAWQNALSVRINQPQYIYNVGGNYDGIAEGLEVVKQLLANGYILLIGTYISSWQYGTIWDDPSTPDDDSEVGKSIGYWLNGTEGAHGMVIVGYNDAVWTDINTNGSIDPGEKGALRIANSWGIGWRDAGFVWLAYDALREVSMVAGGPGEGRRGALQGDHAYILTVRDGYAPAIIAEFTVNHAKRIQLGITLGRSDTSSETPSAVWTPEAIHYQGGAYAFDGSTTAVDGTFVFDFSDLLVESGVTRRYHLGMRDDTAEDSATLTAFKIIDLTTDPPVELASTLVPQTADGGEQVYAYVDYAYSGPVTSGNHPPALNWPDEVKPAIGTAGDTFEYYVSYSDPDGDLPTVKQVYVDGEPFEMEFAGTGYSQKRIYLYATTLDLGTHDYYYYFEDGQGGSTRSPPITGVFSGPEVFPLVIESLAPVGGVAAGGPAFVLTVNGEGFADGAVVMWDGSDRPTTWVSGTRVDAEISAADIETGKMVAVSIRSPGGGLSNVVEFAVSNPEPRLDSISPEKAVAESGGFTLTLAGANFVSGSVVKWSGNDRATTFVSGTELQAEIGAGDIGAGGDYQVTVFNAAPAGGTSDAIAFTVVSFSMGGEPESATVAAGQSATYGITVTPQYGSFDSAITFSASGLPRGCAASFMPASVTPGDSVASTTLTITTKVRTQATAASAEGAGGGTTIGAMGGGGIGVGGTTIGGVGIGGLLSGTGEGERLVGGVVGTPMGGAGGRAGRVANAAGGEGSVGIGGLGVGGLGGTTIGAIGGGAGGLGVGGTTIGEVGRGARGGTGSGGTATIVGAAGAGGGVTEKILNVTDVSARRDSGNSENGVPGGYGAYRERDRPGGGELGFLGVLGADVGQGGKGGPGARGTADLGALFFMAVFGLFLMYSRRVFAVEEQVYGWFAGGGPLYGGGRSSASGQFSGSRRLSLSERLFGGNGRLSTSGILFGGRKLSGGRGLTSSKLFSGSRHVLSSAWLSLYGLLSRLATFFRPGQLSGSWPLFGGRKLSGGRGLTSSKLFSGSRHVLSSGQFSGGGGARLSGSRRFSGRVIAVAYLIWLIVLIGGCNVGGGSSKPSDTGTPAGTYQITVKGTSGNLTVSTTVTLIVQ